MRSARGIAWAALAASALAAGCGQSPSATRANVICDGEAALKLRVLVEPQPDRELRGSVVRVENGYQSFAIDGKCDYWMSPEWFDDPLSRDLGWRRGHADADLERALEEAFPLAHLDTLQDCMPTPAFFDGSASAIHSATSSATCVQGGPRFDAAWSVIESRAADLWSQATPLDGGIRVAAVLPSSGDDSKAYAWPSAEPLLTFLVADDKAQAAGVSLTITDPATAQALRALRDQYISDRRAAPGLFYDGQKMNDPDTTALVYMRDQLPYEDAQGLWPAF